jgi:hypothetical protein
MVTRKIGSLLILRQNKNTPTDEEWDQCLSLLTDDKTSIASVRVLVVTDGGGPTPEQRRRLQTALGGIPVRVAVVSESIKVRFIVSSVALVTSKIKSFDLREFNDALSHLHLGLDEARMAQVNLREMSALIDPA